MITLLCKLWKGNSMKYTLTGMEQLEKRLQSINEINWQKVANKNLTEMFNRAARPPGTPIGKNTKKHSAGELMRSRRLNRVNISKGHWLGEFGYIKDYAPHVEYGHRIVRNGKQVGYVNGTKYLFNNVKKQREIYRQDLLQAIKNNGKGTVSSGSSSSLDLLKTAKNLNQTYQRVYSPNGKLEFKPVSKSNRLISLAKKTYKQLDD